MKIRLYSKSVLLLFLSALCSCGVNPTEEDKPVANKPYTWQEFYQSDFFDDLQMARTYRDSKTFVDAVPKMPLPNILAAYQEEKGKETFDMKNFAGEYFQLPGQVGEDWKSDPTRSMEEHILALWPVLTRESDAGVKDASLIPLPFSYIVPGGRFREVYYWDSYFTMEGLMRSGQEEIARNMIKNFAYLIDEVGFIPNGNRSYYKGRSQPPFFPLMVDLVAKNDRDFYLEMLPALQLEYDFWMDGVDALLDGEAYRRVVKLKDGTVLNRYFDNFDGPRPESYVEDVEIAESFPEAQRAKVYKDLRAGAESGWDYSSRWFGDGESLRTIETTDILPVDLNSLLYFAELKLAQGYNWAGDLDKAQDYLNKADQRKAAINRLMWDKKAKSYVDIYWRTTEPTGRLSMAAAYPLYFNIPDKPRGRVAAQNLEQRFLQPGGFVTTLAPTGQQWDFPNGWAPLQWIGVNALFNYDRNAQGLTAAERWLDRNREVYKSTGKMMEKYNVMDTDLLAGGGEYALQDGFGWTNGIALAFSQLLQEAEEVKR